MRYKPDKRPCESQESLEEYIRLQDKTCHVIFQMHRSRIVHCRMNQQTRVSLLMSCNVGTARRSVSSISLTFACTRVYFFKQYLEYIDRNNIRNYSQFRPVNSSIIFHICRISIEVRKMPPIINMSELGSESVLSLTEDQLLSISIVAFNIIEFSYQ